MSVSQVFSVITRDGVRGHAMPSESAAGRVRVVLEDGGQAEVDRDLLRRQPDGQVVLPVDRAALGSDTASIAAVGDRVVVPIAEESLDVGIHKVTTGTVRVSTRTVTRDELVDVPLTTETADVERVAINRELDGPVQPRQEGETWVIPVVEEVVVVTKRLILKEELRVTVRRTQTRHTESVSLRHTEVTVDRTEADRSTETAPA